MSAVAIPTNVPTDITTDTTTDTTRPMLPRVPVTERALLQRLNRRLAREDRRLHKSRPGQVARFGTYHCVNFYRNELVDWGIDHARLEELGRDKGVLQLSEKLADTE